jgi:hypothetical protein
MRSNHVRLGMGLQGVGGGGGEARHGVVRNVVIRKQSICGYVHEWDMDSWWRGWYGQALLR